MSHQAFPLVVAKSVRRRTRPDHSLGPVAGRTGRRSASTVHGLDTVAIDVRKHELAHFVRRVGALHRPVVKRRAEPVRHGVDAGSAHHVAKHGDQQRASSRRGGNMSSPRRSVTTSRSRSSAQGRERHPVLAARPHRRGGNRPRRAVEVSAPLLTIVRPAREHLVRDVSATVRLRPTRIALLVRPSDLTSIRRFMRACTCLWGGVYNPIIPVFRSCPPDWRSGCA